MISNIFKIVSTITKINLKNQHIQERKSLKKVITLKSRVPHLGVFCSLKTNS